MLEALRWLNVPESTAQRIIESGTPDGVQAVELSESMPDRPDVPYFYVHVFLAALPHTLQQHADRGIPEEVSRATLSDLAAKLAEDNGETLTKQNWLVRHFRGSLYRLGWLQFDRTVVDGEPLLEIHIPGDGPLTPAACDESIAQAAGFFARHFPEEHYQRAVCHSWLLDGQLKNYLSAETNILDFQRRFTVTDQSSPADEDIVNFIFGYPVDRSRLPQKTTLQRAIVSHLAEGHHWYHCAGSLVLPT